MNRKDLIKSTMDAVVASGKKFKDIPKESFYNFFKGEGIENKHWDSLYSELYQIYNPKKNVSTGSVSMSTDGQVTSINHKVDYYTSTHNEVKTREPRKSIFSEIVKIAG